MFASFIGVVTQEPKIVETKSGRRARINVATVAPKSDYKNAEYSTLMLVMDDSFVAKKILSGEMKIGWRLFVAGSPQFAIYDHPAKGAQTQITFWGPEVTLVMDRRQDTPEGGASSSKAAGRLEVTKDDVPF